MGSASTEPDRAGRGALRPWPVLRSLLIAGVLLVHGTKGMPWPDVGRGDLAYGVAQDELARWSAVLTEAGRPTTPDELAAQVLEVGNASRRIQRGLYGPFRPLMRLTGTGQSWGLFAYPDPYAGRLVVSVQRALPGGGRGDWEEVYRAPGQGEPWLVDLLEFRRIRGIYDDNGDRPRPGVFYTRMADWLAAEIMVREPDVAEVMVRLDLVVNLPPDDPRPRPDEKRRHVRKRDRERVADRLALRGAPLEARPAGEGAP